MSVGLSLVGTGKNPEGRPDTDFYSTPSHATAALLGKELFGKRILEPACGEGAISEVLKYWGYEVSSTDLYNYGYGISHKDFLNPSTYTTDSNYDAIITNPPYRHAEEFLKRALDMTKLTNGKVALLLKLQFLEGQKRKTLLEHSPLRSVYVFSKRLTFSRNNEPIGNSGMMAFAWYVWDWNLENHCPDGRAHIEWL